MPRGKTAGGSRNAQKVSDAPIKLTEQPLIQSPHPRGSGRPVPVEHIAVNPRNLRGHNLGTPQERTEMAASLTSVGLIQALVVCDVGPFLEEFPQHADEFGSGIRWVVIAGHRRLLAAKDIGLDEIRIEVQNDLIPILDEVFLDENDKRVPLTPFEEGAGYRRMQQDRGLSIAQIAERRGKSKAHIGKRLRLLDLDPEARDLVLSRELGVDAAYGLLAAVGERHELVAVAWRVMQRDGLTVKEAADRALTETADANPDAVKAQDDRKSSLPETPGRAASHGDVARSLTEPSRGEAPTPQASPSAAPSQEELAGSSRTETARPRPAGERHEPVAAPPTDDARARAVAAAERDKQCRTLVRGQPASSDDPYVVHAATVAVAQASQRALELARRWLAENDLAVDRGRGGSSQDSSPAGDANGILRLAYAVALAEAEVRAADRRRNWDSLVFAHLRHLIDVGGYSPTDWERQQLQTPSNRS